MKIETDSGFEQIMEALDFRDKRWSALQHRIMRDFTKKFKQEVVSRIPKMPDSKIYRESIDARRVTGFDRDEIAVAVLADPKAIPLSDIDTKATVFSYEQTGESVPLGTFYEENGPWVVDFMPEMMMRLRLLVATHRQVTKDEFTAIAKRNTIAMKDNERLYKQHEAQLKVKYEDAIKQMESRKTPAALESYPNWLFQAMRWEFGIGVRQISHWRPAIRNMGEITKALFKANGREYSKYLIDGRFREWTIAERKLKTMTLQAFKSRCGTFAKKMLK